MRLRLSIDRGCNPPVDLILKHRGFEGIYKISHHHHYIVLYHSHCIALHSRLWFDIVFQFLVSYYIISIEPCLWYCVLCIHFTTLHYIILSHDWIGSWDIYDAWGMVMTWLVGHVALHLLGSWCTHNYVLSLDYCRLLVEHDWLSWIYCVRESPL